MKSKTAFVWDDVLLSYRFSEQHPLNPRRLELTMQKIQEMHLLDGADVRVVKPRVATDDELLTVHAREYIDAVKRAKPNLRYGLGTDDVPVVTQSPPEQKAYLRAYNDVHHLET